ncbi:MAG: PQQ-binding-like beta-propeller repeat protein, partial [Acidobacteriota bacterium]|nr:PQQ-binding-like beta-propeller repeat protein [Acidobacteriota bacterium]
MLRKHSVGEYASVSSKQYGKAFYAVMILAACAWLALPRSIFAHQEDPSAKPVTAEFPSQYFPENLPSAEIASQFPAVWTTYASNPGRNAVFELPKNAPAILQRGVNWKFAGAGALPLDGPPLNHNVLTTAYSVGMPVGVSVVKGVAYVGSDNGYTYALNAVTGKLIWAHYGWNMTMSNPLVADGRVYVTTGSAYFNYANTMLYVQGKRPTRGPGLNSMYALDARTGKEIWSYHFPGEAMPTAAYEDGFLYIGTGDGHVYKLNAANGKPAWASDIVSFVSMSSAVLDGKYLFLGGTNPNFFYALDKESG